jgi:hypothetical protein
MSDGNIHCLQGEVVQHVNFPHHMHNPPSHDLAQHYVHPQLMYHQYLRAHQEALTAHIPRYLPQGELKLDLDSLVILTELKMCIDEERKDYLF